MSAMPPGSCLMSKCRVSPAESSLAHALAHVAHLAAQCLASHVMAQHLEAHGLEARAQLARAGHGARVQQRLVLPGPGLLTLVVGEGADAGHEQAALAARPQAHIHLVEPPGSGVHGEQMHDALRQAHEEQLIVDRLGAARFLLLTVRVVQEHQIEIRGITKLHAAELAVADRADIHRPPRAVPPRTGARRTAR